MRFIVLLIIFIIKTSNLDKNNVEKVQSPESTITWKYNHLKVQSPKSTITWKNKETKLFSRWTVKLYAFHIKLKTILNILYNFVNNSLIKIFFHSYIVETWWCKPLIVHAYIIWSNRIHSLKYFIGFLRYRKWKFVANVQLVC